MVDEDNIVLTIEGDENGHFTMKGKINGIQFKAMVDSSSTVTIFEIDDIKEITKRRDIFIRELPKDEEYVDFNKRKLNLLRYFFCHLEVGKANFTKSGF